MLRFLAVFLGAIGMGSAVVAAPFAYDGFDYSSGNLDGKNGGYGWQAGSAGAWDNQTATSVVVSPGSMSYTDSTGNSLVTSGGKVAFTQDSMRGVRNLNPSAAPANLVDSTSGRLGKDGSSIWMSFLFEYDTADTTSFGGITLFEGPFSGGGNGTHRLTIGQHGQMFNDTLFSYGPPGIPNDNTDLYNVASNVQLSTASLIVMRFDFFEFLGPMPSGDPPYYDEIPGEDEVYMWVNPELGSLPSDEDAVYSRFRRDARADDQIPSWTFDRLRITTNRGGPSTFLDEIRLGATFEDVTPIAGDFDGDRDVDGADFLNWQSNAGTVGSALAGQGDANLDGNVDEADLLLWQAGYSASSGSAPIHAVPEPALAGFLIGVGLPLVLKRTFWRRQL